MKHLITVTLFVLLLFLPGCGEESSGPSAPDLTPSTVSILFTGDSSKVVSSQGNEPLGFCEVTASWTICPEADFFSYVLYRSETADISEDQSAAQVLGVFQDPNSHVYIDQDTQWGTKYFYVLRTVDEDNDGVWSNEDSVMVPGSAPAPAILTAVVTTVDFVSLNWTGCADSDFQSYTLYRSATPDIQNDITLADVIYSTEQPRDTLFEDYDVELGSAFYYALCTMNNKELVSWSNEAFIEVVETLPVVQDLEIAAGSGGRTVALRWTPLTCAVDEYQLFFRADELSSWVHVGTSTTADITVTADQAGYYSVKGVCGSSSSGDYSASVNTMPSVVAVTYTIYDNYTAPDLPSGFIFGPTAGQTGLAPSVAFIQDIYAYDAALKGDENISLYSGSFGPFASGSESHFQEAGSVFTYCDPDGSWNETNLPLYTTDSVVFVKLPFESGNPAYVKMYGLTITPDPASDNGTSVSFSYEYQPVDYGFTLFTDAQ